MQSLIEKYSLLPSSSSSSSSSRHNSGCSIPSLPSNNIFLFTSATGNLGCDILARLLADDKVSRIYALNRVSYQGPSPDRVRRRFLEKGLDVEMLGNGKIVWMDGDMTKEDFGLDKETFEELLTNTTTILHNAWPLKFTRSLSQFEPSIIGLHNLLNFAHQSQSQKIQGQGQGRGQGRGRGHSDIRFIFVSSFAAGQSWSTHHFKDEKMPDDVLEKEEFARGMGYGESKFVAEHIVARSGLNASSIRVGQLCGRTADGAWSTSEWVPLMLKESIALKALPNLVGKFAFLPLDIAAQSIRDVALTKKPLPPVLNLRHPHSFSWDICLHAVQYVLPRDKKLPVIHMREWNNLLAKKAKKIRGEDINKHPAIRLSEVYSVVGSINEPLENATAREQEHFPYGTQEITHGFDVSPSLQAASPITKHDAERWARHWLKIGFFEVDGLTMARANL